MHALIVSESYADPVGDRLAELLRSDVASPGRATYETVEQALFQGPPDLTLVVLSPDVPERGLEVLKRVRRIHTRYLLAVGHASDSKLILRALHEGADHFLDQEDMEPGLEAVMARFVSRQEQQQAAPEGRFLAVLGASGGCGASTLAVNIATALAQQYEKCALIDLKPGRGDLSALLDLKPPFNLADVCRNSARLDRAMFEKMIFRHNCGVHLLAAPPSFGDARLVTAHGVTLALGLARKVFPHVVADLEDCFHEEQVAALRQATGILLVARLDFTALRNARRVLDHLQSLGIPRIRVRAVINRSGMAEELPAGEAEEVLGGKLEHFIPEEPKTVNAANNTGIPVVIKSPKAKVTQSIVELTRAAAGLTEKRRTGRFSLFSSAKI